MSKKFTCKHCKKRKPLNPRLKGNQKYCGSPACQQARKNKWEKNKLKKDPSYREKRKAAKSRWRKHHPAHEYQRKYRESHPVYVEQNRKKQKLRNAKRNASVLGSKIVKADALKSKSSVTSGLYALIPYKTDTKKKIVKTDALIVHLSGIQDFTEVFMNNSP